MSTTDQCPSTGKAGTLATSKRDEARASVTAREVSSATGKAYWRSLDDMVGTKPFRDFVVREESQAGLPGLVNLVGIESPGLTAAPRGEPVTHRHPTTSSGTRMRVRLPRPKASDSSEIRYAPQRP